MAAEWGPILQVFQFIIWKKEGEKAGERRESKGEEKNQVFSKEELSLKQMTTPYN